jgi:hypothetical protein
MDINFDRETQRLEFIEVILLDPQIISVYRGGVNPYYTIDPLNTPDDMRIYYFEQGLTYLFDIVSLDTLV